ncbi:MAG: hypothetical protein GY805_35845 [Chloroflexi bacterium]|nr:hypothetical protein [Chloroflexota bacterium]
MSLRFWTNTQHQDSAASHRSKMILLSLVTAVVITLFHIQLANYIYRNEQSFWHSGSPSYGKVARSLIEQKIISLDQTTPTAYRPPLYPLFLATFLQISQQSQPIIVAQSVLAGIIFGLLTAVAYSYTQKSWPALFMIFLFVSIKYIAFDNIVQHETVLFTFLLCLGSLIFISEVKSHSPKKVVGLSLVLGLAALVRPLAPAILMVAGFWFGWLILQKETFSAAAKRVALFTAVFITVLLPWGMRNWISIGTFTLTSTTKGMNLWKGNNPATDDIYPTLEIDSLVPLLSKPPSKPGWWDPLHNLPTMTEAEQDDFLFNLGLQYIRERPFHFLKMGFVKIWALWTPQNIPRSLGDIEWTPSGAKISNLANYFDDILPTLALYLLAIPGIWKHRRSPFVLYLFAWAVALTSIHFVTFAESRFRWPINMLMLPMADVGADMIVTQIKQALTTRFNNGSIQSDHSHHE